MCAIEGIGRQDMSFLDGWGSFWVVFHGTWGVIVYIFCNDNYEKALHYTMRRPFIPST